jgi:hypothetical protein
MLELRRVVAEAVGVGDPFEIEYTLPRKPSSGQGAISDSGSDTSSDQASGNQEGAAETFTDAAAAAETVTAGAGTVTDEVWRATSVGTRYKVVFMGGGGGQGWGGGEGGAGVGDGAGAGLVCYREVLVEGAMGAGDEEKVRVEGESGAVRAGHAGGQGAGTAAGTGDVVGTEAAAEAGAGAGAMVAGAGAAAGPEAGIMAGLRAEAAATVDGQAEAGAGMETGPKVEGGEMRGDDEAMSARVWDAQADGAVEAEMAVIAEGEEAMADDDTEQAMEATEGASANSASPAASHTVQWLQVSCPAPLAWWENLLGLWNPLPILDNPEGMQMHCFGP